MAAPINLTATTVDYTSIYIEWVTTEPDTGVEIYRKESGGTYSRVNLVWTSSWTDTTCDSNTRYYYKVKHDNDTEFSNEADAWTNPEAPSAMEATWSGRNAVLTWTNNGTYTSLNTAYKKTVDEAWTDDDTFLGTLTSRSLTVALENTTYGFRIRAYNSSSGLYSTWHTISSSRSGISAPTDLLLTSATTTSITATWKDNSVVEDGYEVYYKESDEDDYALFETTAADVETSTVTGLDEDTEYTVRVRAKAGEYYSLYATDTVETGAVPDADAVIGTVTVVSQTALTVSWTCDATNEDGFKIYRSTDDTTYTEIGTAVADATSYADTGLDSYTTYYYKVRAYNAYGVSALSSEAHNTTLIDLDPPTGLYAEALSSTSIKLTFTVNAGNATTHYVERKVSGGSYSSIGNTAAGTTNTYTDGTCTADTEYTYRIRAYSSVSSGYGDYSVPITKKTLPLGVDTVRRNEAYFAMGNSLCIASETPQNSFPAYWRSKPIDFSEQDVRLGNLEKTVHRVQLEYTDVSASVPVIASLSKDGGTNWTTSSQSVGTGDGTDKVEDFWFAGVTGKNITLKIEVTDDDTDFSWSGIILYYTPRGEYAERA